MFLPTANLAVLSLQMRVTKLNQVIEAAEALRKAQSALIQALGAGPQLPYGAGAGMGFAPTPAPAVPSSSSSSSWSHQPSGQNPGQPAPNAFSFTMQESNASMGLEPFEPPPTLASSPVMGLEFPLGWNGDSLDLF